MGARVTGGEIPRVLYGNNARLVNNVGRMRLLRRRRHRHPAVAHNPASAPNAARLWENGFLLVERAAPISLVDDVAAAVRDAATTIGRWHDFSRARAGVVRYVIDPAGTIPGFADLLSPALIDVVRAYYGTAFRLAHARAWRIEHIDETEARSDQYANLWHTDEHDVTLVKAFFQLDDLSIDPGAALQVHDVATTRRVMRSGYLHQTAIHGPARRLANEPGRAYAFDAPPGSALLCATPRCLHRAGNPTEGRVRHMAQFTFVPAEAQPDDLIAALPPDHFVSA